MKQKFEKNELRIVAVQKEGFRGFPMMFHPHIEILCVLNGKIKVNVDGCEGELKAGQFCVVLPYILHSYEDAQDARFRLIMVSPQYLPELKKTLLEVRLKDPFFDLDDTFDFLTQKAVSCMKQGTALGEQTACGYAGALMGELLQKGGFLEGKDPKGAAARNLLVYCNEHFSEEISIRSAAAACYVSESFVSKVFARDLGTSFRGYVNALRVSYAKRMLEKTDMKITDIMAACGYKNQSSFNRVFFEACKKTPRQFRKENAAGRVV